MIMNLAVAVLVLSIAYAWMVRGVFSAMLQMICALIAGAIAFAVWEPLAIMLVNASPERGFLSFLESVAWGVALIVPFAVSFLLLRVISDKAVPSNIKNATAIDYAGGAIFGAGTGIISIGILVIGVGNMRVATNFLGYQPLWYSSDRTNGAGALVSNQTLWIPADKIVSGIYGNLSQSTMSSGQALGYWYPELELTGFASRVSPGDGAARNAMRPDDFKVLGTYTVGSDGGTDSVEDLLQVPGNNNSPKFIVDINEDRVEKGQVFGYVVEFEPGAKERGERGAGTLVISNGQVRLLVENDGQTQTVFPVAVISESSEPGQFGRWLFDAQGVYITSTGGKSKVPMGFEFVVPQGYTPVSLFVKNIRVMTSELPDPVAYDSASSRDRLVRTGSILETTGRTQTQYNQNNTVSIDTTDQSGFIDPSTRMLEVLGSVSAKRNLTVSDENEIVGGQGKFSATEEIGRKNTPVSKNLRVERYAIGSGQKMIKLDVSSGSPFGLLTNAARNAPLDEPLKLIDENGGVYEAIGFEYLDREIMELRYTRGSTLTGVEDTPTLSTTREDQKLRIIFIITDGVKISRFVIGDTVIARFTPPIE
jgi:hypothetical protein